MGVACKAGCGVEHRVNKDKLGRIPLCFSLEPQRGDQRQMAACTVTTKRNAVLSTPTFSACCQTSSAALCIIMRSGEGMLRCQPVLNRNHPTLTVKRQLAELIVMGCKPTADKTTAMVVGAQGNVSATLRGENTRKVRPSMTSVSTCTRVSVSPASTVLATYPALRSSILCLRARSACSDKILHKPINTLFQCHGDVLLLYVCTVL